jgi:hypothetical protein
MSDNHSSVPEFKSFNTFYPFYLSQRSNAMSRKLHFVGSWSLLALVVLAFTTGNPWWLFGTPLVGYGFAWIGHFVFEKNKPAAFSYPIYSLLGDWVMFWQLLTRKIKFKS